MRVACSNGATVTLPTLTITSGASATRSAAESAQPVRIATDEAKIDLQVATDHPAQLLEALLQHRFARRGLDVAGEERHDHADAPYPARLLCARGGRCKRSRRRASDQTEEFAAIAVTVIIRESG